MLTRQQFHSHQNFCGEAYTFETSTRNSQTATFRSSLEFSMPVRCACLFAKSRIAIQPRLLSIGFYSRSVSQLAMDMDKDKQLFQDNKESGDVLREGCSKEACERGGTRRVSDDIFPHILNLYGSSMTARDFEIYAADAIFEDPLMTAHGVKEIKSAFYSIPKIFSESRIVEYSITENVISPNKHEILIDNKQYYKFLGRGVDMISLIKLYVEDGKVVRHEDWWNKNPLWNRDTVKLPLFGRIIEAVRRGSMFTTHLMMGFGKDPDH